MIKPSYNTERIALGEELPLDIPLSVILDVSERCNFRCKYCFRAGIKDENWDFAAANENMTMAVFNLAIKQLAEFPRKIKLVSLSGHGEPLCNPLLADMTQRLKESGVAEKIDIHTNASLLTEANVGDIAKAGFTRIIVSLQGLDSSTYERVCGTAIKWECFYNNLKLLYVNKSNDLKVHIKIADVALDVNDYSNEEKRFYNLFGAIADSVFIEKIVPIWKNSDVSDVTKTKFHNSFGNVDYCPLVFYKIMVAPNGEIYPCTSLPPPISLGNIRRITLREAWNNRKRSDFLVEHLHLTRHKHMPCEGCFVPINSITSQMDIIDPYKSAILERLKG